MKLSLVLCRDNNNVIGVNGLLPFKSKTDLLFFKHYTYNKYILMGFNTFESLPKKLENRKPIVLTSNKKKAIEKNNIFNYNDLLVYASVDDFLEEFSKFDGEVVIIGGAIIYSLFLNIADTVILTTLNTNVNINLDDKVTYFNNISQIEKNFLKVKYILFNDGKIEVFKNENCIYW